MTYFKDLNLYVPTYTKFDMKKTKFNREFTEN